MEGKRESVVQCFLLAYPSVPPGCIGVPFRPTWLHWHTLLFHLIALAYPSVPPDCIGVPFRPTWLYWLTLSSYLIILCTLPFYLIVLAYPSALPVCSGVTFVLPDCIVIPCRPNLLRWRTLPFYLTVLAYPLRRKWQKTNEYRRLDNRQVIFVYNLFNTLFIIFSVRTLIEYCLLSLEQDNNEDTVRIELTTP